MSNSIGVTNAGFVTPTFNKILENYRAMAQNLYGVDVDMSPVSPLGQIFTVVAYQEYKLWQVVEQVFYTGYVNYADGQNLDKLAALVGIERNPATGAIGIVKFTGVVGVRIPVGFEVSNANQSLKFKTLAETTIQDDNTAEARVICKSVGAIGNVAASVINRQVTPLAGVWSVENLNPTYNGADIENDTAFRYRIKYYNPLAKYRATIPALELAIKNVNGVTRVGIKEQEDAGHVRAIVFGGPEEEIMKAINTVRGAGISVTLERPTPQTLDISISLIKDITRTVETITTTIQDEITSIFNKKAVGEPLAYSEIAEVVLQIQGVKTLKSLTVTRGMDTISSFGEQFVFDVTDIPTLGELTLTVE